MPRTPRVDFPGARHHVMNRTAERRAAFQGVGDLERFLGLLAEIPGRFGARIHAWALMANHYHLMLDCPRAPLPRVMAWLNGEIARKTNTARGWEGPLFRGRYRNRVVLDEEYWRCLLAYLHLNPVRAGLVDHPDHSLWTSHRAYAGLDPAPPWLSREELLELHGSGAAYREAMDELAAGRAGLPDAFDEGLLWRAPTTRDSALVRVPAAVSTLPAAAALARVAAVAGVDLESLLVARRGRTGNLPRTLAAWWLGRAAAMTRCDIGMALGMPSGSVGAAAHRVRHADGVLGLWRDTLLEQWWSSGQATHPPQGIMDDA